MPNRAPKGPIDVQCPTCNAKPGAPCLINRGLIHSGREDAFKQYEAELRRLKAWNDACRT